jgi:hypothetical protein
MTGQSQVAIENQRTFSGKSRAIWICPKQKNIVTKAKRIKDLNP